MKYMIIMAVLIYFDIQMMVWWEWELGFIERIIAVIGLLIHVVMFFGICYFQLKRRQTNDTEKESSHL